ncbi:MAG: glycosyltransferase family 87 protein [Actinomycetota bacterium]
MLKRQWPSWISRALTVSGVLATLGFAYCLVNPHGFTPWLWASHYNISFLDLVGRINNLKQLQHTGNIYNWNGPEAFTYPPGAIFFFWPVQYLGVRFWEYFSSIVTLWAMALSFTLVLQKLRRATWRNAVALGCWLSVILAAIFPPLMSDLVWGNISTVILAITVIDFFVLPPKYRGVLIGIAAAIKIYPFIFVAWWAWRRRWSEVRLALLSSSLLTLLATLIWWKSAHTFFVTQVFGGGTLHRFRGPSFNSSSLFAFFSRPPFHSGDAPFWFVTVLSLVLLVLAFRGAARFVDGRNMMSAFIVLSAAMRIVMPIAWDHYFVFIPFLFFAILELGWSATFSKVSASGFILLMFPWVFLRISNPTPHSPIEALNNFLEQNIILAIMVALIVSANFFVAEQKSLPATTAAN